MLRNQILGELKWPAASLICTVFLFLFNSWMLYEEFFCFLSNPKKKYEITVCIIIGLLGISNFIHIFCFYWRFRRQENGCVIHVLENTKTEACLKLLDLVLFSIVGGLLAQEISGCDNNTTDYNKMHDGLVYSMLILLLLAFILYFLEIVIQIAKCFEFSCIEMEEDREPSYVDIVAIRMKTYLGIL